MDSVHKHARAIFTLQIERDIKEREREKHDVHVLLSAFVSVFPLVVVVVEEEYKVFFLLLEFTPTRFGG